MQHPGEDAEAAVASPLPSTAMSAEDAWDLRPCLDDVPDWVHNREQVLVDVKRKLQGTTPTVYLELKYPTDEDKEQYARVLWQELPPMDTNPPLMGAVLPGKAVRLVMGGDVFVLHLAMISFSDASMVCRPTMDKCLKLADEILTDGFVTDTEPLMLNVSSTEMEKHGLPGVPPWGEVLNGEATVRPFSVCHHKSAARVITLHLIVNCFLEEPQCVWCWQTHIWKCLWRKWVIALVA